ncbi:MAG: protein-glutamate O-methyltransferase CheR, partial [Halobacteriales archaeon]|nr:protein-glutamate O-methyltransferase CheR [Halobacteriales archaeon]
MSITQGEFEYVRTMVRDRAGIVLEDGKEYLVEARLGPIAREHGLPDPSAVISQLIERPAGPLRDAIIDALTTNETSFFRDIHPWNTLREEILPSLIDARRARRRIRILSGAASTGQEAYTLALILRHHFPELAGWDVTIVGTDISRDALAKARSGTYSQLEVNRGLPAQMLQYFTQTGRDWKLRDDVRSLVEFRELNLVEAWPALGSFDLVLMRNVLIYFETATKRDVLRRIRSVMAPDAYLFLGASETTINIDDEFEPIRIGKSTVYLLETHPLLHTAAA